MKTMGLSRLVLVNPAHFPDPQADAMAAGATDVLANAQVCASLEEALVGAPITDVEKPMEALRIVHSFDP